MRAIVRRTKMIFPEGVKIDGQSGEVTPETGRYQKRLSELRGIYQDAAAFDREVSARGDPVVYEVIDYRKKESDLAFGTTIMEPGRIAGEYFMTRGHYHERKECGEAYYTQSGEGLLLLESRTGEIHTVEMKPGICAFIPPDWAHRSINTGTQKLVFVWFCATDAGHDYGEILTRGMRKIVIERDGSRVIADNPNYEKVSA
jgi:glucose-6-phosphate isomerase